MKEKNQKVEIKTKKGSSGAFTEIYIDGQKLRGVRNYKLEHNAGEVPILTLELNALDISVDEEALLFNSVYGEIEIKVKDTGYEKG